MLWLGRPELERLTRGLRESEERCRLLGTRVMRESEERYRLLVEGIIDYSIIMLDPTGHIVSWNEGSNASWAIAPRR